MNRIVMATFPGSGPSPIRSDGSRPLFVSDLDGTLLGPDATLSAGGRARLTRLLQAGLPFTVASARSIVSIREILAGLPLRLPVIHYNGGFLTDFHRDHHYFIETFPPSLAAALLELAQRHDTAPMLSTHTGQETWIFHTAAHNDGVRWYLADRQRAGDLRLRELPALAAVDAPVVAMTLIDRPEALAPLEQAIHAAWPGAAQTHLYENMYNRPWHWLSIHPAQATKARALERLLERTGGRAEDLVVFGDHDNDIAMFRLAGRAVAVAGATERLKAHADEIIGPSESDSVLDYLEAAWPGAGAA